MGDDLKSIFLYVMLIYYFYIEHHSECIEKLSRTWNDLFILVNRLFYWVQGTKNSQIFGNKLTVTPRRLIKSSLHKEFVVLQFPEEKIPLGIFRKPKKCSKCNKDDAMIKSCVFFLVFTITYKILRHVQHAMAPKPPKKLFDTVFENFKKVSFYNIFASK